MYCSKFLFVTDSIENNIENVHGNVELGQQELQKASEYQVMSLSNKLLQPSVSWEN
jgi:hypothetical protein